MGIANPLLDRTPLAGVPVRTLLLDEPSAALDPANRERLIEILNALPGANFGGLSALLTMVNSCANGVAVVSIDNGYGAGYLTAQINRLAQRQEGA